jgi:hydrogenase maturation protease
MINLIIGYGNSLRSDDAVGQKIAREIAQRNWQNIKTIAVHQLTPELAEEIAQANQVIFIDAIKSEKQEIILKKIQPLDVPLNSGHSSNPYSLLSLTRSLYQVIPNAWWILVPGVNFEFGETFSSVTQKFIPETIKKIEQLISN